MRCCHRCKYLFFKVFIVWFISRYCSRPNFYNYCNNGCRRYPFAVVMLQWKKCYLSLKFPVFNQILSCSCRGLKSSNMKIHGFSLPYWLSIQSNWCHILRYIIDISCVYVFCLWLCVGVWVGVWVPYVCVFLTFKNRSSHKDICLADNLERVTGTRNFLQAQLTPGCNM